MLARYLGVSGIWEYIIDGFLLGFLSGLAGYGFSLLLGQCIVRRIHHRLGLDRAEEVAWSLPVPPWITGLIERFVFTTAVIAQPTGSFTAMAAWLGLKMAANWNRDIPAVADEKTDRGRIAARMEKIDRARNAFKALLCNLVSMFMAAAGGYVVRVLLGLDPFR